MTEFRYTAVFRYRTKAEPMKTQKAAMQTNIGFFTTEQCKKIIREHLSDETLQFAAIDCEVELNMANEKPKERTNKRDKVVHMASDRHAVGLICNSSNALQSKSIKTFVPEKVTCRKCLDVMEADRKRKESE